MKIKYMMTWWEFDKPLKSGCKIQCPSCKKWSSYNLWNKGEVECELCGSHLAIICPNCDVYFDFIYSPVFKVKYKKN